MSKGKAPKIARVRISDPEPPSDDRIDSDDDIGIGASDMLIPQSDSRVVVRRKQPDPLKPAWSKPDGKRQQYPLGYRRIPQRFTEAIEIGLTKHGMDGKGKNGLPGYMYYLAKTDPKAMAHLIGRIMPQKIQTSVDPESVLGQTLEAVRSRIAIERAKTINLPSVQLPPKVGT